MGFVIDDGTGVNGSVKVSDNRLWTDTVVKTNDQEINEQSGKVWSLPFEGINPAATDDYIFYCKNTGNADLAISDFRISADTATTQIGFYGVTGTAASGSTLTPVSRTIGSSAIPTAIIETGTDITGLTSTGALFFMQLAVVDTMYHLSTSSKIIIPKGRAIALSVETATANITGVISLYEIT